MSILEGELAGQIADALSEADIPLAATVTRQEQVSGPPWDPVFDDVDYECVGLVDTYQAAERIDGNVLVNDRKILIVAASLAIVPAPGNTVTIGGATYSVIAVSTDPATALWELQARV